MYIDNDHCILYRLIWF